MKVKLPEIKKNTKAYEPDDGTITFGLYDPSADSFEVNVRNDEPILKYPEEETEAGWKKDLMLNLAGAVVVLAAVSVFLSAAYVSGMIPFVASGVLVYLAITMAESMKPGKLRWMIAGVVLVILIATIAIWRTRIGGGIALISGYFYDMAEQSQAYIYDRFAVPEIANTSPILCTRLGTLWLSGLAGLISAIPTVDYRRGMCAFTAGAVMIAFAYYGMIPSWIWIGVLILACITAFTRGNLLSTLPLMLVVVILFGAVVLINPGESIGISRMDENLRDRFAFRSAFIENPEEDQSDLSELQKQDQLEQEKAEQEAAENTVIRRIFRALSVTFLIVAALGVAAFLYWRRLKKRIEDNKKGIDSADPGAAIAAMFPYCVRWLEAYGIDISGKPFASLIPSLREEMSREYAYRYEDMYALWQEASYSDHKMTEKNRTEMSTFMSDTVEMIEERSDFMAKVRTRLKYAL